MYNTIKTVVAAFAVLLTLASCSNKQSLQEYYVDNQENGDFILVDVPTSLLGKNVEALSEEQQEVFKTVRKILIDNKFEGWCTVEQDCDPSLPGTPLEDARANREFLQSIGF